METRFMAKGKKTKSEETWQTHIYLPESLRKKLEQIAAREHRSITNLIGIYVRRCVEADRT
jgi:hypothetical protein